MSIIVAKELSIEFLISYRVAKNYLLKNCCKEFSTLFYEKMKEPTTFDLIASAFFRPSGLLFSALLSFCFPALDEKRKARAIG